ncbi:MAG: hypothetical protein GF332_01070 [Candidatus Moranbacteria bacterium]|nr:hypothetical protein [Candidatus Moranbacteria bacterium]
MCFLVISYAFGYRFNFQSKVLIRSGTLTLKPTPQKVQILLDGKKIKKKSYDIINDSYSIHGLRPGNYSLKVQAQQHQTWQKNINIHSGIATEFWNVFLPQTNPEKNRLDIVSPKYYKVSEGGEKIIFSHKLNGPLNVFIYQPKKQSSFLVYQEPPNREISAKIQFVEFSADKSKALITLEESGQYKYYLAHIDEIEKNGPNQKNFILLNPAILNIYRNYSQKQPQEDAEPKDIFQPGDSFELNFSQLPQQDMTDQEQPAPTNENTSPTPPSPTPNNSEPSLVNQNSDQKLELRDFKWLNNENFYYLDQNQRLFLVDLDRSEVRLVLKKIRGFQVSQNHVYFVQAPHNLVFKSNKFGSDLEQITENLIDQDIQDSVFYKINVYDDKRIALINNQNQLYLFNDNQEEYQIFKKLSDQVISIQFSDDGKKLLYFNQEEIRVYYLKEWEVQPKNKVGANLLIFQSQDENIRNALWYKNYQHVIFNQENQIKIIEIDQRDQPNLHQLIQTQISNPDFTYEPNEELLYFLDQSDYAIQLFNINLPEEE